MYLDTISMKKINGIRESEENVLKYRGTNTRPQCQKYYYYNQNFRKT
jgi:hypothetical protein